MVSADEYYLYGSGGGNYYGRYTGFAVDAFGPQSRDLYNFEYVGGFYDTERLGGSFGPGGFGNIALKETPDGGPVSAPNTDYETVYACPDGKGGTIISFGTPCKELTPQTSATPTTTTPVTTQTPTTTTPPAANQQLPSVVVPLLIGLAIFAVLK